MKVLAAIMFLFAPQSNSQRFAYKQVEADEKGSSSHVDEKNVWADEVLSLFILKAAYGRAAWTRRKMTPFGHPPTVSRALFKERKAVVELRNKPTADIIGTQEADFD